MECKYCQKECKPLGLVNHELYCKFNLERRDRSGKNNPNYGKTNGNQHTLAKSNGQEAKTSQATRDKISKAMSGKVWTDERRHSHSVVMSKVAAENPESYSVANVVGRVGMLDVMDGYGNNTRVRGTWELKVADWLNAKGILWTNHIEYRLMYYWNGVVRRYYPDFYLPTFNLYIEVKGYETPRDHVKWEAMTNLIVLRKKELDALV